MGETPGEVDGVTVTLGNVTGGDNVSGDKVFDDVLAGDRRASDGFDGVTGDVTVFNDVTDDVAVLDNVAEGSKNATSCEIFFGVFGVGGIDGDLKGSGLLENKFELNFPFELH